MPKVVINDSRKCDPLVGFEPTLTKQAFAEECDINRIIERVAAGDDLLHVNTRMAAFGDVSSVPDYRTAIDMVRRADAMFSELSWKVKERFGNDPAQLLDFLNNPNNFDEGVKLGLLVEKAKAAPAAAAAAPSGSGTQGATAPAAQ